jgi:hypothetical protein
MKYRFYSVRRKGLVTWQHELTYTPADAAAEAAAPAAAAEAEAAPPEAAAALLAAFPAAAAEAAAELAAAAADAAAVEPATKMLETLQICHLAAWFNFEW